MGHWFTEAALEPFTDVDNIHPWKFDVDDSPLWESGVDDTHSWDSDVDDFHSWESDVDDTHACMDMLMTPKPGESHFDQTHYGESVVYNTDVDDTHPYERNWYWRHVLRGIWC